MGGLYNLIASDGKEFDRGKILLAILGNPEVGWFRDAWVEKGEDGKPVIAIYTRNGGGNREHYCHFQGCPTCSNKRGYCGCWEDCETGHKKGCTCPSPGTDCACTGCIATYGLPAHPNYLRDQDDDFDCTYATFYFRVPDEYQQALASVAVDHVDTDQRWMDVIDAIGKTGR